MSKPTLTINELDAERLDTLLAQAAYASGPVAEALNDELDRAEILPPQEIPADVVTMNSKVRFTEGNEGEEHVRTLDTRSNINSQLKNKANDFVCFYLHFCGKDRQ